MIEKESTPTENRVLFDVVINSHPETAFLSLTDLQKTYEKAKDVYGWGQKNLTSIAQAMSFKKTIYDVLSVHNLIDTDLNSFYTEVEKMGMLKYLKRLGLYKTYGARKTRVVYCKDWLWKLFYYNLFKNTSLVSTPKFIIDIEDYYDKVNMQVDRKDSKELKFIDKFLASCNLISSNIEKQYKVGNFKYDLKVELLGIPFIIEYHESQHSQTVEKDYKKYLKVKDDFAYIVIPHNKEFEQLEYIRECLTKRYDINFINDCEQMRYRSSLPDDSDCFKLITKEKLEEEINLAVYKTHKPGIRNMSSTEELGAVKFKEGLVQDAVKFKWVKTEKQIIECIRRGQ